MVGGGAQERRWVGEGAQERRRWGPLLGAAAEHGREHAERADMRARDDLGRRGKALLKGSYDCFDRVVLNAHTPICHSPGGPRCWWRAWHEGSDTDLDDTHLVRWAGRFGAALAGRRAKVA